LPTVYITQSLSRVSGQNIFKRPKSGRARALVVPHVVMAAINKQSRAGELVFSHPDDQPFTPTVVGRHFTKTARANGFKIRFQDLRHSFATQLAEMGEHPQTVQEALGHHDPGFTLRRYTHAFSNNQSRVADRYNEILNGTKKAQNNTASADKA
jgi:integrase